MKAFQIILIVLIIIIGGIFTAPYWGGCGMNHKLCEFWCEIRHFGSSFETVACKGSCAADRVACETQ